MKTSWSIIVLIAFVTLLLTTVYEADSLSVMGRIGKKKKRQPGERLSALEVHRLRHLFRSNAKSNKVMVLAF